VKGDKMLSQGYLEELVKQTKRHVPGWLYVSLMKAACAEVEGREGGKGSQELKMGDGKEGVYKIRNSTPSRVVVEMDTVDNGESLVRALKCWARKAGTGGDSAILYGEGYKGVGEEERGFVCGVVGHDVDVREKNIQHIIDRPDPIKKAVWTRAFINDLPDSSFLYIESGGAKDDEQKTKPRSLRHFPYRDFEGKVDLPHLRNAIARIPQSTVPGLDKTFLQDKARRILEQQKERMSKAEVVFVVSSLDPIEKARRAPLVGQVGVDFKDKYLKPLGVDKVLVTMPDVNQIYDIKPRVVVALGKQASEMLGELADFTLPHPKAIQKRDNGEVARKIKALRKFLLDKQRLNEHITDRCTWLCSEPCSVPNPELGDFQVKITKSEEEKRIVYGVVLDPYIVDEHEDWTSPGEVEKSAHNFLKDSRVIHLQHQKKTDAQVVESFLWPYPTSEDYQKAVAKQDHRAIVQKFGTDEIHSGAWVLGVELSGAEWDLYKSGKINAFSPGGFGFRKRISKNEMPKVLFVALEEKK
jgi:hypothetical protein